MDILQSTLVMLCVGVVAGEGYLSPDKHRETLLDMKVLSSPTQRLVAPSGPSGTVQVNHTIQASVLSLKDNILELNIWNNMHWVDERLSWDPARFGSTMEIRVPSDLIWVPDITVTQSVEPIRPGFQSPGYNAIVTYKGEVTYVPSIYLKTKCVLDESYFYQHNSVECRLTFLSWAYNCQALDIHPLRELIYDDDSTRPRLQWNIDSIEAEHNEIKYMCCPEVYCDVTYTLKLKRIA